MKKTLAWTLVFAMTFGMIALPANAAAPSQPTQQITENNRSPRPQQNRPGVPTQQNRPGTSKPSSKPSPSVKPQQPSQRPSAPQQIHKPSPSKPVPGYNANHRPGYNYKNNDRRPGYNNNYHSNNQSHYRPGGYSSSNSWWGVGVGAIIGSAITTAISHAGW